MKYDPVSTNSQQAEPPTQPNDRATGFTTPPRAEGAEEEAPASPARSDHADDPAQEADSQL